MRMTLKATVARISSMLRGWCGYFDQGPVITIYDLIHRYTERRIRRWLLRRSGRKGTGFGQIALGDPVARKEQLVRARQADAPAADAQLLVRHGASTGGRW